MEAALELPIQSPGAGGPPVPVPVSLHLAQHPPPPPPLRDSASASAAARKPPLSPRAAAARDARFRRSPPAPARDADAAARPPRPPRSLLRLPPNAMARSLLPVTERKSQEENKLDWRARKESDGDIAPDGSSAAREGRQFAVANVGNGGRIYLRYVAFACLGLSQAHAARPPRPARGRPACLPPPPPPPPPLPCRTRERASE